MFFIIIIAFIMYLAYGQDAVATTAKVSAVGLYYAVIAVAVAVYVIVALVATLMLSVMLMLANNWVAGCVGLDKWFPWFDQQGADPFNMLVHAWTSLLMGGFIVFVATRALVNRRESSLCRTRPPRTGLLPSSPGRSTTPHHHARGG